MAFTIDVRDGEALTRIALGGELDMATAPRLQHAVTELLASGRRRILVDVGQLVFCDSAGLNAFVQADKHCSARGGWLRLAGAHGQVARAMEITGVDEVLAYRHDPDRFRPAMRADG
ncbi:MAG TPA: STAS domain-containing protein [Micromonosporaceae bacterium]|nr:STAS domain-containing protein [Micromonosporaceae bacterium]